MATPNTISVCGKIKAVIVSPERPILQGSTWRLFIHDDLLWQRKNGTYPL
jgi:hypothetical protein